MVESARPYKRSPTEYKGHTENSPAKEEAFTIFEGPYKAGTSHHEHDRYAQEVRRLPQAMVHAVDIHLATQKLGDIVFYQGKRKLGAPPP